MSAVLQIAASELRRRLRNRSALLMAVVGPLALATVFGLLVGGASDGASRIGVADADGSSTTGAIARGLLGAGGDDVAFVAVDPSEAERAVARDDVRAVLLLPAGLEASLATGAPARLEVVRAADAPISAAIALAVARSIEARARLVRLAAATASAAGASAPTLAADAQAATLPWALDEQALRGSEVSAPAYYGASMAILLLFFTVAYAPRSLLAERRDGTLDRILATPTRLAEVVVGKSLAVAVLAFGGFCTVWAVTSLAFGARWGAPAGVVVLIAATVLALAGVSMLVASLARTEQGADVAASVVTFTLALLGGSFVPPGQAPELLQRLALLTPNGWALRAFTDLSADAAGIADILLVLAILLALAAVAGGVGVVRLARQVRA